MAKKSVIIAITDYGDSSGVTVIDKSDNILSIGNGENTDVFTAISTMEKKLTLLSLIYLLSPLVVETVIPTPPSITNGVDYTNAISEKMRIELLSTLLIMEIAITPPTPHPRRYQ